MITNPSINVLSKYVDSRYTLVTMTAKRARMIGESGEGLVDCESDKPVSIAVNEIAAGKIDYVRHTDNGAVVTDKAYEGPIKYITDDVDFDTYGLGGAPETQSALSSETNNIGAAADQTAREEAAELNDGNI